MATENTPDRLNHLNHLQRYLVGEYLEDYQEGALTRRQALKYLGAVLGSMVAANVLLAGCVAPAAVQPPAAAAPAATPTAPLPSATTGAPTAEETAQVTATAAAAVLTTTATLPATSPSPAAAGVNVPEDTPGLETSPVSFPGDGLTLFAYLARPKGDGPFAAILVCHENRGLTDYIKDVTRRLAVAGYAALAVDLLSSQGGTDKVSDPAQIPATLSNTPPDQLAGYFLSAIKYLQAQPYVAKDQLGMVGFCFGGGVTWLVATKAPELRAAVPFYGPNPPLEAVPNIKAAMLGIYGGDDQRIDAGIPAIEDAMRQNGKTFEKIVYPGAGHAFHNDTGRSYKPDAASDAWSKALAWFDKYVRGK